MDNLFYYNQGREVPKEAQKPFNNGKFSGTDINPMWRIKKLTEMFGPAGIGWYVDEVTERCEIHGETTISIVNLNLYVKVNGEWSKPIYGTGGNTILRKGSTSDEGYKMAYTDALSVACKALGIGADIWFANDNTKYTANSEQVTPPGSPEYAAPKEAPKPKTVTLFVCNKCGKRLTPYLDSNGKEISIRQHAAGCEKKFGQVLCLDCIHDLYPDSIKA